MSTLDDATFGISTHVSVDSENKMVYWVHYTAETSYTVYRTSYAGQTSSLFTGSGDSRDIDVTVGMDSFYILVSLKAEVTRYNKDNNSKISALSVGDTTERIVLIEGRFIGENAKSWDAMNVKKYKNVTFKHTFCG